MPLEQARSKLRRRQLSRAKSARSTAGCPPSLERRSRRVALGRNSPMRKPPETKYQRYPQGGIRTEKADAGSPAQPASSDCHSCYSLQLSPICVSTDRLVGSKRLKSPRGTLRSDCHDCHIARRLAHRCGDSLRERPEAKDEIATFRMDQAASPSTIPPRIATISSKTSDIDRSPSMSPIVCPT